LRPTRWCAAKGRSRCAHIDDDRLLVELVDEGSGSERVLRRKYFAQIGGWAWTSSTTAPAVGRA